MPEMPEVEAVCRKLREEAAGAVVKQARILRAGIVRPQLAADVEAACAKSTLRTVERKGKNILLHFGESIVHVHLRMTGNLYVIPDHRFLTASIRAVWELADGRGIVFDDQRALGRVKLLDSAEMPEIGLDPLEPAFTPEALAQMARSSRKPSKIFLLDQQYVSGLGNIYAAEALFRAGIDPRKPLTKMRRPRLDRLHGAIVGILRDAVHSVYLTYSRPGRLIEAEEQELNVYGREGEPCRVCGRAIRRIPQGGRSTWFCANCQT